MLAGGRNEFSFAAFLLLFVCFLLESVGCGPRAERLPQVLNRARGGGIFVLYPVVLHLLPLVVVILDEDEYEDEDEG